MSHREVQQMTPRIRESPPILFAVEAYNALNCKNYVRFFRLIQKASFLNACILHRYFNQIRSQALLIIMKAHNAVGSKKIMVGYLPTLHFFSRCLENIWGTMFLFLSPYCWYQNNDSVWITFIKWLLFKSILYFKKTNIF